MENIETNYPHHTTAAADEDSGDLCASILTRFSNSNKADHKHLCAVIGAISQELTDHNLGLSSAAYFAATVSSLERLSGDASSSIPAVEALITILSMVMVRVSVGIVRKRREMVSELVVRVLGSKELSPKAKVDGLKCVSCLLMIRDGVGWSDVSNLYGFLLDFVTDSHPKVRKQSHLCVQDILLNFQGTTLLAPASEAVSNTFERFLLLAGRSGTSGGEGPKGAQEVLYILDVLRDCLVYLSKKHKSTILKYFKTLFELHQPLVSRRVTDCLYSLCLYPELEVAPEPLLDLLCSLALSVSTNETSADVLTFTARLLDVGIRKVFALDRQICIVKLPLVFSALRDILAFEYEEALFASAETMKSLIRGCIDEDLIQQGVSKRSSKAGMETAEHGPTVIEKICKTMANLLDYQYSAVWDLSFQIVSHMFDRLGACSYNLFSGTLRSLEEIQKLSDEDFPYRKQLHECIGSALGAMGPENFLSLLPLNLRAENLSEANLWLFPILKQYTVGARLSFYINSLLSVVGHIKEKSRRLEAEGKMFSSRNYDAVTYSIWSVLPSFCNYPLDTAESFEDLEKILSHALSEESDLHGIICTSLCILVKQNKQIVEAGGDMVVDEVNTSTMRVMAYYTHEVASKNLRVLRSCARDMLSVLSKVFLKSSGGSGGSLQNAIGQFSSIADKKEAIVSRVFKSAMQKLLKLTQDATEVVNVLSSMQIDDVVDKNSLSVVRGQLLDLAVSYLPGLGHKEIEVLYLAVVPSLKDEDGIIQKKAYKVLSVILKDRGDLFSLRLENLLKTMIEVLPSCHFSAKHHRLDCLYYLILTASKDDSLSRRGEIISSFLTEIILSLKEANKKTRNRAYEILVQIGRACGDEEKGGKKENLFQLFNMVAGGLAGDTPHMISAAVKGLARLAYEFSDLVSSAINVLPSTFLLLQRKNREITKANLGLVKVLIAKSQAETLQSHLGSLVEGLLNWQDDTKNHFKAKVSLPCGLRFHRSGPLKKLN